MTCSLLIAQNLQVADDVALSQWKWERSGADMFGRAEYRRPDRLREVIRFVADRPGALRGLSWNTTVYLAEGWRKRNDASEVMGLLDSGFFKEEDPELLPPRVRPKRDQVIDDMRRTLDKMTREQRR